MRAVRAARPSWEQQHHGILEDAGCTAELRPGGPDLPSQFLRVPPRTHQFWLTGRPGVRGGCPDRYAQGEGCCAEVRVRAQCAQSRALTHAHPACHSPASRGADWAGAVAPPTIDHPARPEAGSGVIFPSSELNTPFPPPQHTLGILMNGDSVRREVQTRLSHGWQALQPVEPRCPAEQWGPMSSEAGNFP